ncbi:MAG: hypothetical protein K0S75_2868, partial [Clostridia bacterium]|nr:hypothetical protein [Clostridia bacterium]
GKEEDNREIIFDASGDRYQKVIKELEQYADISN